LDECNSNLAVIFSIRNFTCCDVTVDSVPTGSQVAQSLRATCGWRQLRLCPNRPFLLDFCWWPTWAPGARGELLGNILAMSMPSISAIRLKQNVTCDTTVDSVQSCSRIPMHGGL
jgi:hypothetical protein